ncbi:MAG TPA: ATP-binding protein [Ktedonobacterales bacterium]|nr:ATP-binding protein [Ktedonobacterales bacterium]
MLKGNTMVQYVPAFDTPISLDRDSFMRHLIAGLGHLNEGILGSDVAGAYIMNVGLSMGAAIEAQYKQFWGIDRPFTLDEYAHVIVDLKQKIKGNFSLVSKDPAKVVVRTTSCPFDEVVRQSPSLCFMTSSVFGGIAARNFGYAKVVLHQRIALGDPGCYVTVHLQRTPEAQESIGKEYFQASEQADPDIVEQLRLMERVQALHQELGESHARWEEVMRAAAEAVVILGPEGTVLYANARWREFLGIEGGELVGQTFHRLLDADDQETFQQAYQHVFEGKRAASLLLRLRHRDGDQREALTSIGPLRDDTGRILGALAIFHDVTEAREMERLKDELLTSTSHELRTPVTSIKTLTSVLLRVLNKQGSIEPEQLKKRLETIQREADRLAWISSDLLDISRLRAGKLTIQPEPEDLNGLVIRCIEEQQARLTTGPGQVQFLLKLAPGTLPVRVERGRVEQIITNLLDNAVKYSPVGGEIAVATWSEDHLAHLAVADHGIGIPADELGKIFLPFYRATNAASSHFTGLGFGLYLSRVLVEAHGGELQASSSLGQGATFTVTLPRYEQQEDFAGDNNIEPRAGS